ncbi:MULTISPECIES: tRNA (adenosine(37)-N6)-threonylcarbamoyltransferase complex transferase subunit TsaD [Acidobacterium]|uniref:tRNA N6-adenosine threonylcarbamoyltransferase n=1 Tax=Acidobacterium capsulatum (strain ATCC 51196 / DSM 11244 / BCRC 80197 / JCM 7670 / NBRC 15755 / NCIMB 13165 / 161) TaxID=240015 RepID=C1F9R2_ACIC5|nr:MULTISPECIES: tRNA (adenosine(37)-N6)-threonylcarbamoyltransferase complex transferase subunit TsaD [Acidobacterium]ACO34646.1 metalloendopeptidase, glycoprotease family [Acidobacterium capsulatum ATCC 51196]HCT62265.1 tRNA (adenosine(37)-N6)-threonylcarbamoyltransferase complex transferase subunit TsaD [Acidobacterium sp.]
MASGQTGERARTGLILGIESSCDETSAAVVRGGREALSNVIASQIAVHAPFGGVVPELASREHLRAIVPVVEQAMAGAGVAFDDLDAVAVTEGPGLPGALLVGVSYAKALALALGKPLIAVNHLEGHIHAVLLERVLQPAETQATPEHGQPKLALVVSGGHTHLYLAQETHHAWTYRNVGRTVDDAAGEAFDKVAKLLGLGYPGGPWVDALAPFGDARAVPFSFAQVKAKAHRRADPVALHPEEATYFSFSGIKTAVLRYVQTHDMEARIAARRQAMATMPDASPRRDLEAVRALCDQESLDLLASFQRAVVGDLVRKTFRAAERYDVAEILVSGGVAANRELRERFTAEAAAQGLPVAFPSLKLATDNAAMIAAAAWPKLITSEFAGETLTAAAGLKLGS